MTTNEERQLGRAKVAVLTFFENSLIVPKIYLDATWDGTDVDVLAINRDGAGDVHAALLFPRPYFDDGALNMLGQAEAIESLIGRFQVIPAQYKYVAAVETISGSGRVSFGLSPVLVDKSFSPDGIGRIGFLTVSVPWDGEPQIQIQSKPERFRAKIAKLADEYIQQHEADWEIRT